MSSNQCKNFLSIDVEEYFHVSAFESVCPPSIWDSLPMRAEFNTEKILELLDSHQAKATFFILGWVAARSPHLVQRIAAAGHEIASHGYRHQRITSISRKDFRNDIRVSKKLLEDLTGKEVYGYRAPSYSISPATLWAFDEMHEAGYRYDSSVFPVRHDFYGMPNWPRFAGWVVKNGAGEWQPSNGGEAVGKRLFEIPITTLNFGNVKVPISGGGYFRFFPYYFTRWGLSRINKKEDRPFVFYLHPWELDPGQPRMKGMGAKNSFRHYCNLKKTEARFRRLLADFSFEPLRSFCLE